MYHILVHLETFVALFRDRKQVIWIGPPYAGPTAAGKFTLISI